MGNIQLPITSTLWYVNTQEPWCGLVPEALAIDESRTNSGNRSRRLTAAWFVLTVTCNHRLNMKFDLQSLLGLHVHSRTHWLRPTHPHHPAFGLIYEGAIGQLRKTTSLCGPLPAKHSCCCDFLILVWKTERNNHWQLLYIRRTPVLSLGRVSP
jgi:hypothetical protein